MLNNKSELEKVLAKQRKVSEKKQVEEKEVETEFHKMLSERAKRLEQVMVKTKKNHLNFVSSHVFAFPLYVDWT